MTCRHQRQVDLDGERKLPCAWPSCEEGNGGNPRLYTHRAERPGICWTASVYDLGFMARPAITQHAWEREVMQHQPPGPILPWEEPRRWYFWRLVS